MDPALLTRQLDSALTIRGKGRGGIMILDAGTVTLACRKYVHGGVLRAVTGKMFLSGLRALKEMEITSYLREMGFPVVDPFAVIVEDRILTKRLYFITVFEEEATDLLKFLAESGRMARYRKIRKLAEHIRQLEVLGIYHPDLHLNNVLIARDDKEMKFLDFDRSSRGNVTKKEVTNMIFRLNRYAEKMEKDGIITFTMRERMLFLRAYQRLSGFDIILEVEKKAKTKKFTSRLGWFIERLLYNNRRSNRQL
ncbi:MAG: hypothetical protein LBQ00_07310 [Syntrophobacterales bacterium]|nr:hypothetical protein [Syntrophobacterales bacterium]